MTYNEFIQSILDTRGRFNCEGYKERHHIQPRCIGGNNDLINLIDLYPQEHFIAHRLLYIENKDNEKLAFAFLCMANPLFKSKSNTQRKTYISETEYAELRVALSNFKKGKPAWNRGVKYTYEQRKNMIGVKKGKYCKEANHFYGKHHTEKAKKKMRAAKKNFVPWNKGIHLDEETKNKLRLTRKVSYPVKGKHWFTNGELEILAFECPDGYIRGRSSDLKNKVSTTLINYNKRRGN